jgi:hypothetical protein
MAENTQNIAVIKDRLPAKGEAVKVVTADAAVVSVVNKMESFSISDSTSVGCSKMEELPKDRFTEVKIIL